MKHAINIISSQIVVAAGPTAVAEWKNNLQKALRIFGISARAEAQVGPVTDCDLDVQHKDNAATMLSALIEVVGVAQANLGIMQDGALTATVANLIVDPGETIQVLVTKNDGTNVTGFQVDIAAYGS